MSKAHLTELTVRSLRETGSYLDDTTPAFGIRVGKNRKAWFVIRGQDRLRTTIGHYPDISLSEARKKALVLLGSRTERSVAPSFHDAREQFIETHSAHLRASSAYQLQRTLRRYFHWKKPLDKITHNDITIVIDGIVAKSEASHALKDLKTFFSWCVPRYIPHSPCEGLKAPARYVPRSRVLSDDELKKVWNAADQMGFLFGMVCQLLMATGQRRNQISSLRWSWIDKEHRLIKYPADVMKGGREHTLPYSELAASILEKVPDTGDLLFPARGGNKPATNQGKIKQTLDTLAGVSGYTIHDFRRTVAVGLQKCAVSVELIETILAHRSGVFGGIVGIYQRHSFQDEMREAIEKWEARLAELLNS
jgi:integrase